MKSCLRLLAAAGLLALSLDATAATWRVNNNPGTDPDFSSLQAAFDAAADGDVILVEPSGTNYGDVTLNKRLTVYGAGFNLAQNGLTRADLRESRTGRFTLEAGSTGTVLMGLVMTSNVEVRDLAVTIARCSMPALLLGSSLSGPGQPASNSVVVQSLTGQVSVNDGTTSVSFSGCQIHSITYNDSSATGMVFSYCVLTNFPARSTLESCVITSNAAAQSDSTHANCFAVGTAANGTPGVTANILTSTFFANFNDPVTEKRYILAAGSPGLTGGLNGTQAGMYGGPTPFIPGAVPPLPAIEQLVVPAAASQAGGLNITVRASVNL